jgi:cellulose synthase/poly-beta-1,6-N-acetylglucosamine synthase-like glycosyltransferase
VTDGSDDGTPDLLQNYPNTTVHHLQERNGKIGAMNRGMEFVKTPIVFSDANTNLGKESIRRIVNLFSSPKVGCFWRKIVDSRESDVASGAGEGIYWKYESALKNGMLNCIRLLVQENYLQLEPLCTVMLRKTPF